MSNPNIMDRIYERLAEFRNRNGGENPDYMRLGREEVRALKALAEECTLPLEQDGHNQELWGVPFVEAIEPHCIEMKA